MPRLPLLSCAVAVLAACGGSPAPGGGPAPGQGPGVVVGDPPGPGPGGACLGDALLASLGSDHLLVGMTGEDADADAAPYDLRYQYLAGGIGDPTQPCPGWSWWACWWQDVGQPPGGAFPSGYIAAAKERHEVPMLTYYELLQASGAAEGKGEVDVAADATFMRRYLGDWRFLVQHVGQEVAILHVEPDFWGYVAQQATLRGTDCAGIPAAVASADPDDCGGYPDTMSGLGQCMIAMARRWAPNAKVGLHASAWGTNWDVLMNADPLFDVAGHARALGRLLVSCGAGQGDFVAADMSDRDAGFYQSQGRDSWWDATDASLPDFQQALTWGGTVAETVGLPLLWWQVPVGNMAQANVTDHWKDNRVDYLFAHWPALAAGHAVGVAFGAGATGQTTPGSDGGNLAAKAAAYRQAGGQALCR